jgi:2,4-dienoyl-CoA reductase-like NADH-dependent reductase (Old Yellow Enzyme family)
MPGDRHDLFSSLTFRNGVVARNRAWLAPMTNQQSHHDGSLSDDELRWLELRAKHGFGVIETCASHVALDGQGWEGELGIFSDELMPGLTRLASMIREHHSVGLVQLFHGGVRSPSKLIGQQPWSASTFQEETPGFEAPRPATERDITGVITRFAEGALRAHRAGFHGVELHGAHGYLLSQFESATMNTRTDGWGGSFEGRARLMRETLRAVRRAVPAEFVVGVRISPEDFGNARGLDLDESLQLARWLSDDGADFLHLSLWDAARNTTKRPNEHAVPLFRAALPADLPIVVAGKVWTRGDADALLEKGADAIAVGRAAIANPDWVEQDRDGREPRRPPLNRDELVERGLSPGFVEYMTRWKGFVAS